MGYSALYDLLCVRVGVISLEAERAGGERQKSGVSAFVSHEDDVHSRRV